LLHQSNSHPILFLRAAQQQLIKFEARAPVVMLVESGLLSFINNAGLQD
jgi:hypothetical protein